MASWADFHITKLQQGETVCFRPRGNSMKPRINSGDLVVISPKIDDLKINDIVLCKVGGKYYVHLITAISENRYQIGNNHGKINGWVTVGGIFGRVTKVSK